MPLMPASRPQNPRHTTWSGQMICLVHTAYVTYLCRLGYPYK